MSIPTAAEVISRYLFDSPTPPEDLKDDDLIRAEEATGQAIHIDMSEYMATGAGRFANATLSTLVSNFFENNAGQLDLDGIRHEYSVSQMISLVGGSQSFSISQYSFHDDVNDNAERAFIFGTTGFKVSDEAVFVVDENGNRTISNFAIYAFDDNFDFVSSDIPTQLINYLDRSLMDPSGIGRVFDIEYENKSGVHTSDYDVNNYGDDLVRYSSEHGISHWPQLASDLYSLVTGFGPAGITSFLADPEWEGAPVRPVYYGTTENDHLGPSDVAATVLVDNMDNGIILLGGEGKDQIVGAATDDILYGGGDNDHLAGGDGYDQLYDGSGADVLEGGAGGDDFNLSDDGEADIVIVEGDDWISGGEANDRIVFRTDLLGLNPAHQDWSNPAAGLSTPTTAIPLLGGFINFQDGDIVEAYYSSFAEGILQTVYHLPEDPDDYYQYSVTNSGSPLWGNFVSLDSDPDATSPTMANEFSIFYQKFDAPFDAPEGQNALYIEFRYWVDGSRVTDNLYIADFDDGDFGIQFQNPSTFAVPPDAGGGTLTYNTPSHVAYINNYGSYTTVPDRISDEGEQQRLAPQSSFGTLAPRTTAALNHNDIESHQRSIDVDTYVTSYHNGKPISIEHAHLQWDSAHSGGDVSGINYADIEVAPTLDSDVSQLNSADGIWYEPEPIGGLV